MNLQKLQFWQNRKKIPLIGTDENDNLFLKIDGQLIDKMYLYPTLYTDLKTIAHSAFALFLSLTAETFGDDPNHFVVPSTRLITKLVMYKALLLKTNETLKTCCGFTNEQLFRQIRIIKNVDTLLTKVLVKKLISNQEIQDMARVTVDDINSNIKDAVDVLLTNVDGIVTQWKNLLTPTQWNLTKFLVLGSHMPRRECALCQYFAKIFDTPIYSGHRIIYAEAITDWNQAIDLLGVHLTDFAAGKAFWGSDQFMHSDIQANYAKKWIENKFGGEN